MINNEVLFRAYVFIDFKIKFLDLLVDLVKLTKIKGFFATILKRFSNGCQVVKIQA
jgi:hypothetical protein